MRSDELIGDGGAEDLITGEVTRDERRVCLLPWLTLWARGPLRTLRACDALWARYTLGACWALSAC